MNKKLLLAVVVTVAMSLFISCSDDELNPTPPAPNTLAEAYIHPTEMLVSHITKEDYETGYLVGPGMAFKGNEITYLNNPELFAEYNRFFGDTAYVRDKAKGKWPLSRRTFLVPCLVGLKAIAADGSWGKDYPEGSDVSKMFYVQYLRAAMYVESRYQDDVAIVPKNVCMSDWKPEYGKMLCDKTTLVFGYVRAHSENHDTVELGHKYTLVATFDDGTTLTSYDNTFWCDRPAFKGNKVK
jgi:lipoprotein